MEVATTAPYRAWIAALRDLEGRARIQVRINRLLRGNPGQHRVLTHGVVELKIDIGPGYRVYYTESRGAIIVVLAGGDKSSQPRDIALALELAASLGSEAT
jgi:putative addiction module killer protein